MVYRDGDSTFSSYRLSSLQRPAICIWLMIDFIAKYQRDIRTFTTDDSIDPNPSFDSRDQHTRVRTEDMLESNRGVVAP